MEGFQCAVRAALSARLLMLLPRTLPLAWPVRRGSRHAFPVALAATLLAKETATASVDDTPMAGAVNKMFKGRLQHV